jgi:hypothetical protein
VYGHAVADLTHLVAELVENAVHFSPPEANVIIRTRPNLQSAGAFVLTVEDWGLGMRPEDLAAANDLLAAPSEVDLSVSRRLGLHVVARLAQRHGIAVSLTPTPGCGVTAAVALPPSLFADGDGGPDELYADDAPIPAEAVPAASAVAAPLADLAPPPSRPPREAEAAWLDLTDGPGPSGNGHDWSGWWELARGGDPRAGEPPSPIAARPPLAERVAASSVAPPTAGPLPASGPAGGDGPPLSRRVPQAHLAPELRRHAPTPAPPPDGPVPDPAEARAALSRYQASRLAARAMVDDPGSGPAPDGPERPAAAGGRS